MSRSRDYKAEYARRIARGLAQNLSRSQARGHPRAGEAHASSGLAPATYNRRLEHGLGLLREGQTLTGAAQSIGVSSERLRHYLNRTGIVKKQGRRWVVLADHRPREMKLFSEAQVLHVLVNVDNASLVGRYMSAVGHFLETNNPRFLRPFSGVAVVDVYGHAHLLETRPNVLYRLDSTGEESFEQVYRIVI
jgi:hypothetical protein